MIIAVANTKGGTGKTNDGGPARALSPKFGA